MQEATQDELPSPTEPQPPQSPQSSQGHPSYLTDALPVSLPNPASIPDGLLTTTKYGLAEPIPDHMTLALRNFSTWETNAIQLNRLDAFVHKVQQPTSEGHKTHIKSFLGFASTCFNRPLHLVNLSVYLEPIVFLAFISFLKVW